MSGLDRLAVSLLLFTVLAISLSVSLATQREVDALKNNLSHAKCDATAAENDAKTLASINSIQERLDTIEREKIEMGFSQTTLSGIISTRVYFLEQRIAELENANASGEVERDDSPSGE